jgi:hypothetical protein
MASDQRILKHHITDSFLSFGTGGKTTNYVSRIDSEGQSSQSRLLIVLGSKFTAIVSLLSSLLLTVYYNDTKFILLTFIYLAFPTFYSAT